MDYNTLSNEINQPQYAGMSDAEIAAALNAPGASTRRRVPIADLQAGAMETGVYTALRVVVGNAQAPTELRAVAQTVLDLANARFDDVDLDNPASVQMFGVLQQAGVITAQQAAEIDALANVVSPSRATVLGLGVVVDDDIQAARDWKIGELQSEAAMIDDRLAQLTEPTDDDLLEWARINFPFAARAAERDLLTARLGEINDILTRLGG